MEGHSNYMIVVNLVHIFIQGLLLVYIGYKKNETPKFIYYILGGLALLIPFSIHKPGLHTSYWNLINVFHYLFVMPLFLYIAYQQKFTDDGYNNLLILGIIIIVYHLLKLIMRLLKHKQNKM